MNKRTTYSFKHCYFRKKSFIFAAMFEKQIEEYERIRKEYQQKVADKMGREVTADQRRNRLGAKHSACLAASAAGQALNIGAPASCRGQSPV